MQGGSHYGTAVGAGDIGVVVGGSGTYGPYLADGLPATGPTAELDDPRGLAVGPTGALFVTDGFMHAIRVVPASDETLLGHAMTGGDLYTVAGALPVQSVAGAGNADAAGCRRSWRRPAGSRCPHQAPSPSATAARQVRGIGGGMR